jgi:hypothetical protein
MRSLLWWLVGTLFLVLAVPCAVFAAPPWTSLIPLKRVEADANTSYGLREEHGPWLILAASFAGEGAEEQAHELVLELRKRYNLTAYVDIRDFDFTERVEGNTIDRYTGGRAKMKYAKSSKFESFGVLVGNFETINDPKLQKTLDKVKYMRPAALDLTKRKWSTQRFIGLRELQRRFNGDPAKRKKGPMGNAFVTRNPHLPEEYFAPTGLDDFVIGMNRGVKYSLLTNPGRYTVRVASFGGKDTMNLKEIAEMQRTGKVTNKLEIAADKAHRLTVILRQRGVEAYEFHDRIESIVTVGSFDSYGEPRQDGKIEINPVIHQIMQMYGAKRQALPGQTSLGLQPRSINGISFEVQPIIVVVPRRSIAADYARRESR